jgi:hypothetical protein
MQIDELDFVEPPAEPEQAMSMNDWAEKLDKILTGQCIETWKKNIPLTLYRT